MATRNPIITSLVIIIALAIIGAALYYSGVFSPAPASAPDTASGGSGSVTLALGKTGVADGASIAPLEVLNDSRCPTDVLCIQAGTISVRTSVNGANYDLTLGESIQAGDRSVTLVEAAPAPISKSQIKPGEYRLTYKVVTQKVSYTNASSDLVKVDTPFPGAVTGKRFSVKGQARGPWYFEASFPIRVLDTDGKVLATAVAQADGAWMTNNFVPFSADVTIPATYTGSATLELMKDNPSGLPQNDASVSFPIVIEY
jgi:hypothetical protein